MLNDYAAALEHLADLRAEAQAAQRVTELLGGRRPRRRWLGRRPSAAPGPDGHYI